MPSILDRIRQWRAIPGLVKDLKGDDRDRFERAVRALNDSGWKPKTEEEKLLYYSGRYQWNELAAMGPVAVPVLLKKLADGNSSRFIAKALGTIKDPRAVPGLVKALQDKSWGSGAKEAAEALGEIKDRAAIPGLLDASKQVHWGLRKSFVSALMKIGWRAESEEEKILYFSATQQWDELVHIGGAAVPELLEVMGHPDVSSRQVIIEALVRVGRAAVPQLLETLKVPGGSLGHKADVVAILGRIKDPLAVPGLLQELARKNWSARSEAAEALGEIGDASAVPGLLDAFNSDDGDHLRQVSLKALVRMGGAAVAGLLEVLGSGKTYKAQCAAAGALGQIKDRAAVPGLLKALKSSDWDLRRHSASALAKIGWLPQTEEEKILYYGVRQNWDELVKIGRASASVLLEALSEYIQDKDMRLGAEATLVKIGSAIVPELLAVLKADEYTLRLSAISVLGKLHDIRALPGLIEALKDSVSDVRLAAIDGLGEAGDAQAVPGLTKALKDTDADVRWFAAEAIEKIEDAEFIKGVGKASPIPDLLVALSKAQREAREKRAREEKEQWATLPRRNCSATPFKYGPLYAEYNSISDTLFKLGHPRGRFRYELVLKEAAHGESDADGESHYYPDQYEWVKTPRASLGSVTGGTH